MNLDRSWPVNTLSDHCARTAVLAREIGRRIGLSLIDLDLVHEAALWHHDVEFVHLPYLKFSGVSFRGGRELFQCLRPGTIRILSPPEQQEKGSKTAAMAEIVALSSRIDDAVEAIEYEPMRLTELSRELKIEDRAKVWSRNVIATVRNLPKLSRSDLALIARRLPVFPKAVLQLMRTTDECDFAQIEQVASSDQVLAGSVVAIVNSTLLTHFESIGDLRSALVLLGVPRARRTLLCAAMRPLMRCNSLDTLWEHSIKIGKLCRKIAVAAGLNGEEAYLAGLVHDIGRLVIARMVGPSRDFMNALNTKEIPVSYTEYLIAGSDHGDIGADVLSMWNFPRLLIESVRFHHSPECGGSKLASVIYLAECVFGADEQLASAHRKQYALQSLHLDWPTVQVLGAETHIQAMEI